ncbi:hypothetical protein Y032_0049g1865 [Ancylostoma ceylanicum]|uniref:Uncharacterized protein n=1 Tax=Ancylostoma ceylanicum TaxID=53326 RepID=A0A016U9E9_9BILA|nr:hypothetical protein Y032_0049g1865 [Ancylostoma ceylanicum]
MGKSMIAQPYKGPRDEAGARTDQSRGRQSPDQHHSSNARRLGPLSAATELARAFHQSLCSLNIVPLFTGPCIELS